MDKLKFKAYIKDRQKIVDVEKINLVTGEVVLSGYFYTIASKAIELLQYTGMKSKSGDEFYQGDIISTGCGQPLVIKFINGCFMACDQGDLVAFVRFD